MEISASPEKSSKWLYGLDGAVWLGTASLVLFTISRHEPWSDEAQAWLLARDLGWFKLIFFEMRYEGNPGLWHSILWVAIHLFHLPYAGMGYVGGAFACMGLAVIIFYAPFPRILRYLTATSFFFIYQYAVVARPYELIPLLAFVSSCLLRKGTRRVILFAVILSLLAFTSSHGAVFAIALAVEFAVKMRPQWSGLKSDQKKRVMVASAIFSFALAMFVVIVFPPYTTSLNLSDARTFSFGMHVWKMFASLYMAFSGFLPVGIVILSLVVLWLLERRGALLFLIAAGGTAFIYGFLRGTRHHMGIILIALLTAVWAAWPTEAELKASPRKFLYLHRTMVIVLSLLFTWQSYWSVVAIGNDWHGAYSGAKDAAIFIKSIHAENAGCNAYNYGLVGVQPYFDHNIFANLGGPDAPAYYHFSVEFDESVAGEAAFVNRRTNPPCLLIAEATSSTQDIGENLRLIETQGYELVHASDGWAFFRDEAGERQIYWFFILRPGISKFPER